MTGSELHPGRGIVAGAGGHLMILAALVPFRDDLDRAVPALGLVVPVLVAALIGGRRAALAVSALGALALNVVFLAPYGTVRLALWEDVIAFFTFVAVSVTVGTLSRRIVQSEAAVARQTVEIADLRAEAETSEAERRVLEEEAARARDLEATEAQRAAVLRSVSHDLRTPLATIRAVVSDIRSGTDYNAFTRNELLDIVSDEAERLDRLVSNLLALSRIEAGALSLRRQAVDLEELLRDRTARLARLFRQVRLVLDVDPGLPLVDGDYGQLDQLVTNLLENASRYAPPRSTVTVRAHGDPLGVMLSVEDEGIGVAEHERGRIFEPFQRGEESRSSGVGLAICRGIVERHGGRIWVDRTPGGGATFRATLPAR